MMTPFTIATGLAEVKKMKPTGILSVIAVCAVASLFGCSLSNFPVSHPLLAQSGTSYELTTEFPQSPAIAAVYEVTGKESFTIGSERLMDPKTDTPSVDEAPSLALKALEGYGGLPEDAVLHLVEKVYLNKYDVKTGINEPVAPQWTLVIFEQEVQGNPVIGPGAEIWVALGENGGLLQLDKVWRTVKYQTDVPIITSQEAFSRLSKGEMLIPIQSGLGSVTINKIKLGYYAEDRKYEQKQYKPVWIFYGKDSQNNDVRLPVMATES